MRVAPNIVGVRVFSIAPVLALLWAVPPNPCERAQQSYQSLSLEKALSLTKSELSRNTARPLLCLDVRARTLIVSGRLEEAREVLEELFERSADYEVHDPSFSPGLLATIQRIREEVRPLEVSVQARWLIHESLQLEVLLKGGLRGATRVRFKTEALPSHGRGSFALPLVGRAATATVAVATHEPISRLIVSGQVLDGVDRVVQQFSAQILLGARPKPKAGERVIVEVQRGGVPWPVWVGIGVAAVASGVIIGILAQPDLPDTDGTIGRVRID